MIERLAANPRVTVRVRGTPDSDGAAVIYWMQRAQRAWDNPALDVAIDAVTIEVTGDRGKLEAMLRVLEPFGIRELVQSGMVAINRGSRSITDRALKPAPPISTRNPA